MNDKVYIHEFIDITKQHRAQYMQHITANWSPIGQELRHQLCYGVWGVVGSTGRWPQVVNIWEEDGFAGLAKSFRLELNNTTLQDPALAKWWNAAADLRSGGVDRLLIPHSDTQPIEELCAAGTTGEVYAHEIITVRPHTAPEFLDSAMKDAQAKGRHGWQLVGAWWTALHNEDEAILLWAIPDWDSWGKVEQALSRRRDILLPECGPEIIARERILLVDSPLSPFRTNRQPTRADRTDWAD